MHLSVCENVTGLMMVPVAGVCSPTSKARRGVRMGPRSVHLHHKLTGRGRLLGALPRQAQESRSRRVWLLPGRNKRRRPLRTLSLHRVNVTLFIT